MAWTVAENVLLGQPITETSTTKKHELGFRVNCKDPTYGVGEFIYLQGIGSTAIGSAVVYRPDNFITALASTSTTGFVAVAMSANVASQYGWYQIAGKAIVVAGTVADDAAAWATATPGTLDDATADGDMVHGAFFASADGTPSAGFAELEIMYPYLDGIATND
jgi:hypothetical protein